MSFMKGTVGHDQRFVYRLTTETFRSANRIVRVNRTAFQHHIGRFTLRTEVAKVKLDQSIKRVTNTPFIAETRFAKSKKHLWCWFWSGICERGVKEGINKIDNWSVYRMRAGCRKCLQTMDLPGVTACRPVSVRDQIERCQVRRRELHQLILELQKYENGKQQFENTIFGL